MCVSHQVKFTYWLMYKQIKQQNNTEKCCALEAIFTANNMQHFTLRLDLMLNVK